MRRSNQSRLSRIAEPKNYLNYRGASPDAASGPPTQESLLTRAIGRARARMAAMVREAAGHAASSPWRILTGFKSSAMDLRSFYCARRRTIFCSTAANAAGNPDASLATSYAPKVWLGLIAAPVASTLARFCRYAVLITSPMPIA